MACTALKLLEQSVKLTCIYIHFIHLSREAGGYPSGPRGAEAHVGLWLIGAYKL
jgi:hypothetical protein